MWFVGQSTNLVGGTIKCRVQDATMEFTETVQKENLPFVSVGYSYQIHRKTENIRIGVVSRKVVPRKSHI